MLYNNSNDCVFVLHSRPLLCLHESIHKYLWKCPYWHAAIFLNSVLQLWHSRSFCPLSRMQRKERQKRLISSHSEFRSRTFSTKCVIYVVTLLLMMKNNDGSVLRHRQFLYILRINKYISNDIQMCMQIFLRMECTATDNQNMENWIEPSAFQNWNLFRIEKNEISYEQKLFQSAKIYISALVHIFRSRKSEA